MVKSLSAERVKWDHVTSEKMFDMVCDAVKETLDNPPEQVEMSRVSTDNPAVAVASQPEIPASRPDVPADNSHVSIPDLRTNEPVHVSSESSSFFLDLLQQTEVSKGSGAIFDSHWMMVTDSGGQLPFLDPGALFLRNNSLQIFCLKLNKHLNDRPELSYFVDGKPAVFADSDMQLSNQQIIETMAKSISAFQPALTASAVRSLMGPRFAVIGTFEDQAHNLFAVKQLKRNSSLLMKSSHHTRIFKCAIMVISSCQSIPSPPMKRNEDSWQLSCENSSSMHLV